MKARSGTEHRTIVDTVPKGPVAFPFRPSTARTPQRRHAIRYYEDAPDREVLLVHASLPVNADPSVDHDFAIVDLPEIERAATIVPRSFIGNVMSALKTMARWIDAIGCRSAGYNRELYIECGEDRDEWVTELQAPITTS